MASSLALLVEAIQPQLQLSFERRDCWKITMDIRAQRSRIGRMLIGSRHGGSCDSRVATAMEQMARGEDLARALGRG